MERADAKITLGSERKGHKRKLAENSLETLAPGDNSSPLPQDVEIQVNKLNSSFSWREADCLVDRRATLTPLQMLKAFAELGSVN